MVNLEKVEYIRRFTTNKGDLKVLGQVSLDENNTIAKVSGNITRDIVDLGHFTYTFSENSLSKSINVADEANLSKLESLIPEVVEEIKDALKNG